MRCAPCLCAVGPVGLKTSNCKPWAARCCKSPLSMALAPSCGHSNVWVYSSSGCTASRTARRRFGASSVGWGSHRKSLIAAPSSAMKMPYRPGSARLGRRSKKAERQGRLIVFIDESGLSERPTRVRTWAPKGQTPVIQFHFNWTHISVIAWLSHTQCLFHMYEGSIKKEQHVEFLKALRAHLKRPLLIIWDAQVRHQTP